LDALEDPSQAWLAELDGPLNERLFVDWSDHLKVERSFQLLGLLTTGLWKTYENMAKAQTHWTRCLKRPCPSPKKSDITVFKKKKPPLGGPFFQWDAPGLISRRPDASAMTFFQLLQVAFDARDRELPPSLMPRRSRWGRHGAAIEAISTIDEATCRSWKNSSPRIRTP